MEARLTVEVESHFREIRQFCSLRLGTTFAHRAQDNSSFMTAAYYGVTAVYNP